MTTTDDLRRTLDRGAATASDGTGMTGRIHAGAQRIRRRRRVTAAAVSACLVAVAVVAVTRLQAEPPPPPAAPAYRKPGQLTVRPAAGSTSVWRRGSDGTMQWMLPSPDGRRNGFAVVRVYDPGTYDSSALERGEKITVGGHPAFWGTTTIESFSPDVPPGVLTVGWQDASGAWVTVVNGDIGREDEATTRERLVRTAEEVRLGTPEEAGVPVHFSRIPGDLPLTFSDVSTVDAYAKLGFGAGGATPAVNIGFIRGPREGTPLRIEVWQVGSVNWTEATTDRPGHAGEFDTTVAGHPAHYYETDSGPYIVRPGASVLTVALGTCGLVVSVKDKTAITRADLETMVAGATVDDCTSPGSWTKPVS
ncbi:hypothetical protein [Actinoplanes sp. RD1]|uniref:hypothetical protein n=1 Tax=Actinoplanes sp. RD1 TaxID=3064538 RepID=UPI002741280A|nr:hypothetical protein [Actinoplanes sp. RD1]